MYNWNMNNALPQSSAMHHIWAPSRQDLALLRTRADPWNKTQNWLWQPQSQQQQQQQYFQQPYVQHRRDVTAPIPIPNNNKVHVRPITNNQARKQQQRPIPTCPMLPTNQTEIETEDLSNDQVQEFQELLFGDRKIPPPEYVCHCCFTTGHYIYDCPKRAQREQQARTPYQGPKTSFGQFMCSHCKHRWNSPKSARDTPQKCNKCKVEVYPHKQFSLETAVSKGLYRPRSDSRFSETSSNDTGSESSDVFANMSGSFYSTGSD